MGLEFTFSGKLQATICLGMLGSAGGGCVARLFSAHMDDVDGYIHSWSMINVKDSRYST